MAIRNDERLHNVTEQLTSEASNRLASPNSYLSWPRDPRLQFKNIRDYLEKHPGKSCDIIKLVYEGPKSFDSSVPLWRRASHCKTFEELNAALAASKTAMPFCEVYLIKAMDAEPFQLIGHELNVNPRFFNRSKSRKLYVSLADPESLVFSLPFMDIMTSSSTTARDPKSSVEPHLDILPNWKDTEVRLVSLDRNVGQAQSLPCGILLFDQDDVQVRNALEVFVKRMNFKIDSQVAGKIGLYNVATELFYILVYTWETFVSEARAGLNNLERECVTRKLTPKEEFEYALRLHGFRQVIDNGRQCVVRFHELIDITKRHVFFAGTEEYTQYGDYAEQASKSAENVIAECDQIQVHATRLSGLIEAKRAVAEGVQSNMTAASMRRVTYLTFFYLPLTLIASIFGMNVNEIVSGGANVYIWTFCATAFPVMLLTFVIWGIWAKRAQLAKHIKLAFANLGRSSKDKNVSRKKDVV